MTSHTERWSPLFIQLVETNPFCVTDDQLFALLSAMNVGPLDPPDDLSLLPVKFCRGSPVLLHAVLRIHEHLRYEYSWDQLAQIILTVLKR